MRVRPWLSLGALLLTACFVEDTPPEEEASGSTGGTTAPPGSSDSVKPPADSTTAPGSTGDMTGSSGGDSTTGEADETTAAGDWWDPAWSRRYAFSFNNGGPDVGLTDVPVLVVLTPARVDYAETEADGVDLRFVADDGQTVLDHEIETWSPGGESTVWVRVPTLELAAGNDRIYLYTGNPAAEPAENAAGVWSNGYGAVFHLNDDLGEDATMAHNSVGPGGSVEGTMSGDDSVAGQIGRAFAFDGDNDMVTFDLDVAGATEISLEGWTRQSAPDNGYLLSLCDLTGRSPNFGLRRNAVLSVESGDARFSLETDAQSTVTLGAETPLDSWSYLALSWRGSEATMSAYVDGVPEAPDAVNGTSLEPGDTTWVIANSGADFGGTMQSRFLAGQVDEVRVSTVARAPSWVAAQYLSMTDGLISYGQAETLR
ncbi:MAG: DUF2341 domain-containing protein [Myxococcota bacterium]